MPGIWQSNCMIGGASQPPFVAGCQSVRDSPFIFSRLRFCLNKASSNAFAHPVRTIFPAMQVPEDALHDKVRAQNECVPDGFLCCSG